MTHLPRPMRLLRSTLILLAMLTTLMLPLHAALAQPADASPPETPAAAAPADAPAPQVAPAEAPTEAAPADHATEPAAAPTLEEAEHHADVAVYWVIPFALLLACIALMPLFFGHFWEHKYPVFAAIFFLIGLGYYWLVRSDMHPWFHEMREYVSFIALLFALFVVSGGIVIHVSRKATPRMNVALLLTGAIIANIFGTTGAAMLLIRPYIRINRKHIKPYHIIFFIFLVANVGGCLTPVGDPPLFLGYLKGVPFWWVLEHCWQPWLVATIILLIIFFVIDKRDHAKEERHDWGENDTGAAVRINGMINLLLILIVILAVFRNSMFEAIEGMQVHGVSGRDIINLIFSREIMMVGTALISLKLTKKGVHEVNEFTFGPIREVAIIFLAIFSTMVPALEYLDANAEHMPLRSQGQFYFSTGGLSSVLDNAPTYLTFLQARLGEVDAEQVQQAQQAIQAAYETHRADDSLPMIAAIPKGLAEDVTAAVRTAIQYHEVDIVAGEGHLDPNEVKLAFLIGWAKFNGFLIAISVGAVFFGAMTYIGNAPNFMVKSIAESSGIKMPSFLGYVFKYSATILLPVLIVIWLIFFAFSG